MCRRHIAELVAKHSSDVISGGKGGSGGKIL